MTTIEAFVAWHARHAPWCDLAVCRSHTVRLNGPDLVNGQPDGPLAALAGELAPVWRARIEDRRRSFDQLVDELLEQAGPVARGLPIRRCVGCGCTDERACPGGCWWAMVDPPFCSACMPPAPW